MRMADIFPEHIREWIAWMQREGRSAWTIQYCKSSILNSIFTTALNDQVTYIHPCRGVKIPTVPATPRTIVTPEQFDAIYAALPNADAQLLVETAIETGLRWGELAELRPGDLDLASRMLTVSRKVIELNREFHPDGRRFLVKQLPQGQGIPAAQAQPADHREAQGAHPGPQPGRRTLSCSRGGAPSQHHCGWSPIPRHTRPDRAERGRPPVPARHAQRLHRRKVPLRPLSPRVRGLPGPAPRGRGRRPPAQARGD